MTDEDVKRLARGLVCIAAERMANEAAGEGFSVRYNGKSLSKAESARVLMEMRSQIDSMRRTGRLPIEVKHA